MLMWGEIVYPIICTSLLLLFLMPRTRSVRFFSNILNGGPFQSHRKGDIDWIPQQSALSTAFSKTKIDPPPMLQDGGISWLWTLGNNFLEKIGICNCGGVGRGRNQGNWIARKMKDFFKQGKNNSFKYTRKYNYSVTFIVICKNIFVTILPHTHNTKSFVRSSWDAFLWRKITVLFNPELMKYFHFYWSQRPLCTN